MNNDIILGWHFRLLNGTTRYLRQAPPLKRWQRCEGEIIPCHNGLLASRRATDALQHATGSLAVRVKLRGDIVEHNDKLAARERLDIWRLDATEVLRSWARRCAWSQTDRWAAPDIVRQYLLTGDESKRAAAWAAARDVAWAAAWAEQNDWLEDMLHAAHEGRDFNGWANAAMKAAKEVANVQ